MSSPRTLSTYALYFVVAVLLAGAVATPAAAILDPRCVDLVDPNDPLGDLVSSSITQRVCALPGGLAGVCTILTCFLEDQICVEINGELICDEPKLFPREFDLGPVPFVLQDPCGNPDHIVQCDDDPLSQDPVLLDPADALIFPVLYAEEQRAKAQIRYEHSLPLADEERIMGWARDDIRARLYARLVEIGQTAEADRTIGEQKIAEAYEEAVQAKRIQAAELSIQEYDEWASSPCTYVPPEGFSYEPNPGVCDGGTLIILFDDVEPPPVEEFLQYGFMLAGHRLQDPSAMVAMAETARALQFVVAAVAADAVAAISAIAVIAAATAIFTHASAGVLIGADGAILISHAVVVAKASAIAGGAALGIFFVLFILILTGIIQFIFVFTAAAVPDQLDEALAHAQNTPVALSELVASNEGKSELFLAFIETTLPDFRATEVPDPDVSDPLFRVTDEDGSNPIFTSEIQFRHWTGDDFSARLNGGWFVVGITGEDGSQVELLELSLEVEGWDGVPRMAHRDGRNFLIAPAAPNDDGTFAVSFWSEQIPFVDTDGAHRLASIFVDESPPEITPQIAGTLGENAWYTSDVTLSWQVSDPETAVSEETGCGLESFTVDGPFSRTCSAKSGGGTSSETVDFERDATPPTISGSLSGAPNAVGWHKMNVDVSWTCADATSGVANCSATLTLGEGADQSLTGAAADHAGNVNTATVDNIDIDETPPVVVLTTPGDGLSYVLHQAIPADWSAADALSGLASPAVGTVADGIPIDTATPGTKSFIVTATDRADNVKLVTHIYTVLEPEEAAAELIEDIEDLDLPAGTESSLVSKLEGAIADLENGKTNAAEGKLRAFIQEVEAQRGKALSDQEADALIALATAILGAL